METYYIILSDDSAYKGRTFTHLSTVRTIKKKYGYDYTQMCPPTTLSVSSNSKECEQIQPQEVVDKKYVTVYTDGSAINNGKKNAKGGFSVFYGTDDSRNISKSITKGIPTNNRAELYAIVYAIRYTPQKLKIYTDSTYVITCYNNLEKWKANNWKLSTGKLAENVDLLKRLKKQIKKHTQKIKIKKVAAHTKAPKKDDPKYKHWFGNNQADKLAKGSYEK